MELSLRRMLCFLKRFGLFFCFLLVFFFSLIFFFFPCQPVPGWNPKMLLFYDSHPTLKYKPPLIIFQVEVATPIPVDFESKSKVVASAQQRIVVESGEISSKFAGAVPIRAQPPIQSLPPLPLPAITFSKVECKAIVTGESGDPSAQKSRWWQK